MYHRSRGGVRGGRDQFNWDEVKADKHRENHIPHQTKVLSMNISCCENCPRVLEKKLLKMPGVDSVAIDIENDLVHVVGYIDATTLMNKVAKLGKAVRLLPGDKQQPRKHVGEGRGSNFAAPKKGLHKNCCCQDGRHTREKQQAEDHKSEAYVPPSVDERICRDFYCKTHPRGRIIVDTVPAESSAFFGMMGQMPVYSSYGPYGGGSHQYPGWYGEEQPQFGYGRPPSYLPRPQGPFGFQ